MNNVHNNINFYTDEEVVKIILTGNNSLFELIIRRYNPILYKIARGYGFNHQDTEDLMQETFINCYQNLNKFKNKAAFKTWLVRIMLNLCYHKKVDAKKILLNTVSLSEKNDQLFITNEVHDTSKTISNKELKNIIELALNNIPDNYKKIFTLRELAGLNIADTAELLNITPTNVKARLSRAKSLLRKEIETFYSVDDIFEFNLIYCDKIVHYVMDRLKNHKNL